MTLFGPLHLSLLAAITAAAAALALYCRRRKQALRPVRLALGWAIALNELVWWVFRYSHEGVHLTNLPLQLCDLAVWLSVLACLTGSAGIVEFAYFAGMAGAGMALLTPDLWSPWPTYPAIYFFLAHGAIVIAVAVMAFGRAIPFRQGAVWRSFGWLALWAAAAGSVNALTGANYMYLCRKPGNASLLDRMGPWPWYLAGGGALGLTLFWLLWLPVRPKRTPSGAEPAPAPVLPPGGAPQR